MSAETEASLKVTGNEQGAGFIGPGLQQGRISRALVQGVLYKQIGPQAPLLVHFLTLLRPKHFHQHFKSMPPYRSKNPKDISTDFLKPIYD